MKETPTFNEFKEAVLNEFKKEHSNLSDKECEDYINSKESLESIKNRYDNSVEKFENGKITYDIFMVGVVNSVAYCLDLMY